MDSEQYGVRRKDIDDRFADDEHCAICGTDEEKLLEVAVIGEDECVLVCGVCMAKHARHLDEELDDVDHSDGTDADGEMDDDMR
jgi:hypothetical protein